MADLQDSWREVASKAESLGLKLKLHLEQEQDETSERQAGDTKAMVDEFGQKLTDAFDSLGNAAKDPAVHADVKEIGTTLRDALMSTFAAVGAEVNARTKGATSSNDGPQDAPQDDAELETGSGDESDGTDS